MSRKPRKQPLAAHHPEPERSSPTSVTTSSTKSKALLLALLVVAVGAGVVWAVRRPATAAREPVIATPADAVVAQLVDQYVAQVRADARSAVAHGTLGLVYEANEMWDAARRCFENAAALAPREPLWRYHQAIASRQAGDAPAALDLLRALAAESPKIASIYHRLGEALLETGEIAEAAAAFQRAIDLAPNASEAYVGLADTKLRQRDYAGALGLLTRALQFDSSYRVTHYLLGIAYRGLGRADDAARELSLGADAVRRFIADPFAAQLASFAVNRSAQLGRAADLIEAGRPDLGASILESALGARPGDVDVMNNLAAAYMGMKHHERALSLLRQAEQLKPGEFATFVNLATCSREMKRPLEALRYADRAVALAPNVGRAHFVRARVLAELERYQDALDALEAAARLDARNHEVFQALGEMSARLERFDDAREYYRTAVKLMPASLPAQISLCGVCIRLGDLDEAAAVLDAARKLAPGHERVVSMEQRLADARAARNRNAP